ncbi:MAG: fumarylacetoacetate hydrolase family protein [Candidatus Binataceae bacterium]
MRVATFSYKGQAARLGAPNGGLMIDLNAAHRVMLATRGEPRAAETADAILPAGTQGFLDGGERAIGAAREALAFVDKLDAREAEERSLAYAIDSVKLHAPVPRPGTFIFIGLNYRDHAAETGAKIPEHPTLFSKSPRCVIANGEAIKLPKVSKMIDYEAELAVVIGKRAKDVARDKAREYVAGYTIINDVSCRDYQRRTNQWMAGKTFDTFAPMGPYLVLTDEIPDPHVLDISLEINGKRLQHSNTKNLIFDVNALIADISQFLTLEPGDVISTGTPGGVGFVRNPQVFLQPGDRVKIEIAKIGVLENPVEAP